MNKPVLWLSIRSRKFFFLIPSQSFRAMRWMWKNIACHSGIFRFGYHQKVIMAIWCVTPVHNSTMYQDFSITHNSWTSPKLDLILMETIGSRRANFFQTNDNVIFIKLLRRPYLPQTWRSKKYMIAWIIGRSSNRIKLKWEKLVRGTGIYSAYLCMS